MLEYRQFGVAIPNGTEILIHFRSIAEALLKGAGPVMACIDIDFENCYPTLEWDSIREAVARDVPSLLPWVTWCHAAPVPVYLPSGEVRMLDRGAEQGDPLGNVFCALVLAGVARRARETVVAASPRGEGPGYLDAWYADDGQVLCKPTKVDPFLRALDVEASLVGASREHGSPCWVGCSCPDAFR